MYVSVVLPSIEGLRQSADTARKRERTDLARLRVWHLSRRIFRIRQAMMSWGLSWGWEEKSHVNASNLK